MTPAEQFELPLTAADPFELALEAQWRRNEIEQAERWGGADRYVIAWWSDGNTADVDGWRELKEYERNRWRSIYEAERGQAEGRREMRRPGYFHAEAENAWRNAKALAESWAVDLRKAFLEGKPCPIRPAPGYEAVLWYAFHLAQVPEACLPADPDYNPED